MRCRVSSRQAQDPAQGRPQILGRQVAGRANNSVIAIAVQACIAAQLGMALGARIGERWRENAERVAALALVGLGIFLLIERLVH